MAPPVSAHSVAGMPQSTRDAGPRPVIRTAGRTQTLRPAAASPPARCSPGRDLVTGS